MTQTCENCLNAYNSPHDPLARCWNKEWEAQFRKVDCHISRNETCGTWQQRQPSQPKVKFQQIIQLTLFD